MNSYLQQMLVADRQSRYTQEAEHHRLVARHARPPSPWTDGQRFRQPDLGSGAPGGNAPGVRPAERETPRAWRCDDRCLFVRRDRVLRRDRWPTR